MVVTGVLVAVEGVVVVHGFVFLGEGVEELLLLLIAFFYILR